MMSWSTTHLLRRNLEVGRSFGDGVEVYFDENGKPQNLEKLNDL